RVHSSIKAVTPPRASQITISSAQSPRTKNANGTAVQSPTHLTHPSILPRPPCAAPRRNRANTAQGPDPRAPRKASRHVASAAIKNRKNAPPSRVIPNSVDLYEAALDRVDPGRLDVNHRPLGHALGRRLGGDVHRLLFDLLHGIERDALALDG